MDAQTDAHLKLLQTQWVYDIVMVALPMTQTSSWLHLMAKL